MFHVRDEICFTIVTTFTLRSVSNYLISEVSTRGVLYEKVLLEISQNQQEKTCARVSFLRKLQISAWNLIKKKNLWHRWFPVNFSRFLRIYFLQNTFGRLVLSIPFDTCGPVQMQICKFWYILQKISTYARSEVTLASSSLLRASTA